MRDTSPMQESLLLANLGFYDSAIPEPLMDYLRSLLQTAMANLESCGVKVDTENLEDALLSVMYAAWLYRCGPSGGAMPPMLSSAIRNRQVALAIERGGQPREAAPSV